GGHSLKAMLAISKINKVMGIEAPLNVIFERSTIKEMSEFISNYKVLEKTKGNQFISNNVILFKDKKDNNIFAFPPIVTNGVVYRHLANQLNKHALYALNFIEEENKIQKYIEILKSINPNKPFLLLGYSAGGNIAFEVAKELQAQGNEIKNIILMDTYKMTGERNPLRNEIKSQNAELLIKQLEEQHERKQYNGNIYTSKALKEKIEKYKEYISNLNNLGNVKANISLIKSADITDTTKEFETLKEEWEYSTTKKFQVYRGYGAHSEMLKECYVEKNAQIIKDILAKD
ncbi:thioesterase domain-containing protein, partial [Herbivorax sp. ANBcel31]|uniref:thioesterase domain-containing protein n=1 Tax=Herbivorax sp. ANBcel31 TaxID=3069754 RepID=UPI0027B184FD